MKVRLYLIIVLVFAFNKYSTAQPCGIPDVLLFGTIQTNSSASPYWVSVPGALSYNFEYRIRNTGAPYSAPIPLTDTTITLNNLTPSTDYEFIVQAICATDTSPFSLSGWFTTWADINSISITRGPYMTVAKSSSVTMQWKTNSVCNTEVNYGTSLNNLNLQVNDQTSSTNHSILISNLQPNTKYYYSVGIIGTSLQSSADNFFYTAPADNDTVPLRFWVTGDFGSGNSGQTAVRNSFTNFTAGTKVNGWLWLGDNAYSNGAELEYQNKVFDVYPSIMKNIPLFPALGNHDYAQSGYQSAASLGTNFPYFSLFSIPTNSGTEKYYSTNYGNIHFIALDSYGSYNSFSSAMFQWLEADLSNNTQQWTVVYFHHPPYTKGSHDSDDETELIDMRNNIIPLLESNGVDLVLSGHSHAYERSSFMKGHFGNASSFNSSNVVQPGNGPYAKTSRTGAGTIYAVCGVSGQLDSPSNGFPHNAMHYSNATNYGSLILDIRGNNLTGQFLSSNGSIMDEFTITKPGVETTSSTPEIVKSDVLDFEVYPNPARNEFNISINNTEEKIYNIKIYTVTGQTVLEKTLSLAKNNSGIKINRNEIEKCNAGIYLISISNEQENIMKSLIVE